LLKEKGRLVLILEVDHKVQAHNGVGKLQFSSHAKGSSAKDPKQETPAVHQLQKEGVREVNHPEK